MTTGYVDDAESPKTKSDAGCNVDALVIRATMNDRLRHALDDAAGDFALLIEFEHAANAAHILFLL
jgi:hypothetical protein